MRILVVLGCLIVGGGKAAFGAQVENGSTSNPTSCVNWCERCGAYKPCNETDSQYTQQPVESTPVKKSGEADSANTNQN